MAGIREELTLVNNFSGTFNQFNTAANASISTAQAFKSALDDFTGGFLDGLTEELQQTNAELDEAANGSHKAAQGANEAADAQEKVTRETKATANAASGWVSSIKSAITALGVGVLAKKFVETADEMTLINARLNAINDSTFVQTSLQDEVYQAAIRSRSAYSDTAGLVARLGQNAGDLFNNAEAVKFAETMNKAFKIGGASQNEISSATLQLSQALATGVLRGEEFNAVNEAAPSVIRRIADEMGVPVSQMRDMAQQGQITAAVVKSAMLNAADEIDADFANLPKTFQDYVTEGKNMLVMGISDIQEKWTEFLNTPQGAELFNDVMTAVVTFAQVGSEALLAVANGIAWVHQNWEQVLPIIEAAGAAMIAYGAISVASAVASAAAWAVANWPILALIAVIMGAIAVARNMGVTFWQIGNFIGQAFGLVYATGYNAFVGVYNLVMTVAEFLANVFVDPVHAIINLFVQMFDVVLGIVQSIAGAIDTVFGSSLEGAVSSFKGRIKGWTQDIVDQGYGAGSGVSLNRMENISVSATAAQWGNVGMGLGLKLDHMSGSLDNILGGVNSIDSSAYNLADNIGGAGEVGKVGSVGKIDNDVTLSDEDLKVYRDLAEQRYLARVELKTLAPNINVSIPGGGQLQPEDVANAIKGMLVEQMAANAATAH
jgi:tape measure domain-containing protein